MRTYTVTLVIEAETPEDAHAMLGWILEQGSPNVNALFDMREEY
jgi:hypothetical protein